MSNKGCPVCGTPTTNEDCNCNHLECSTCGQAVLWFGNNEGTDPCEHVIAMGGVGYSNTEWYSKQYEQMFDKFWKEHSVNHENDEAATPDVVYDTVEEALESFAESNSLNYVVHDNGLSKHALIGVYVLFKKTSGSTVTTIRPANQAL